MEIEKKWILKPAADPEVVSRLSSELGVDRVLAELLAQRGVSTFEEARAFFRPSLDNLHDPFLMKDMDKAVERLTRAVSEGEKILIYPEQGMWWNYRKPRPMTNGAFRFAVNNNVPVIPLFITMKDTDSIDGDGFPIQLLNKRHGVAVVHMIHIMDVQRLQVFRPGVAPDVTMDDCRHDEN